MSDVLHTVINSVYVETNANRASHTSVTDFFRGITTPSLKPLRPGL